MIEVTDLRKTYKEVTAVDGISFTAEPGRVFGLLGPNGAGKSTTIGCISGLIAPTSGHVRVGGHDVVREPRLAKARLGIVPQEIALYEEASAAENLSFWGAAFGLGGAALRTRIGEVLEIAALQDRAKSPVRTFSGGMKRRLNFACGIIHHPEVLLLDEPTVGVDPQSRVRLLELVREQAKAGACVLYTTHYMEEAERLCDRIGIIDHGRIIALGTLPELRAMLGERDLVRFSGVSAGDTGAEALGRLDDVQIVERGEGALTVSVREAPRRLPALLEALSGARIEVRETTMIQPSLESLFIKLTGRELRE